MARRKRRSILGLIRLALVVAILWNYHETVYKWVTKQPFYKKEMYSLIFDGLRYRGLK